MAQGAGVDLSDGPCIASGWRPSRCQALGFTAAALRRGPGCRCHRGEIVLGLEHLRAHAGKRLITAARRVLSLGARYFTLAAGAVKVLQTDGDSDSNPRLIQ